MTRRITGLLRRAASPGLRLSRSVGGRVRMQQGRALASRVAPADRTAGWISVIMPAKDVAGYIDASLASVLGQSHTKVEVIVLDDASTDGTRERIAEWERRDPRVRAYDVDFSDPNACRNFGIGRAAGEFLTFVDGDDLLLPGAYRELVAGLGRTGSDFVAAGYDRVTGRRRHPAAFWIDQAHATRLERTTLEAHPEIMVNAVQWSKVYRRSFWDRAELAFPEGGHFQDQVLSARAYSRARAFDVHDRRTVSWRVREDGTSMTQQTGSVRQIGDRFATSLATLEVLRREASPELARRRLVQYLSNDLAIAASRIPDMDDAAYEVFASGLARLAPSVDREDVWSDVPAAPKVLYALVLADDEVRARAFVRRGGLDLLRHRMVAFGGAAHVCLPYWGDAEAVVDPAWFRASSRDLAVFADHGRVVEPIVPADVVGLAGSVDATDAVGRRQLAT